MRNRNRSSHDAKRKPRPSWIRTPKAGFDGLWRRGYRTVQCFHQSPNWIRKKPMTTMSPTNLDFIYISHFTLHTSYFILQNQASFIPLLRTQPTIRQSPVPLHHVQLITLSFCYNLQLSSSSYAYLCCNMGRNLFPHCTIEDNLVQWGLWLTTYLVGNCTLNGTYYKINCILEI